MLEVRRPGSPQIHPDGHRVAFEVEEADFEASRCVSHLWITEWLEPADDELAQADREVIRTEIGEVAHTGPSQQDVTRQLTYSASTDGEWDPQWSPDGAFLAFLSDRTDSAIPEQEDVEPTVQVWILPIDGGEARKMTSAKEGVLAYRWMPDSTGIVYVAPEPLPAPISAARKEDTDQRKIDADVFPEERLRRSLYFITVETSGCPGKPELLWQGDFGLQEFAIAPNGESICFTTNGTGDPNDYHKCDLWMLLSARTAGDDWTPFKLTDRPGDKCDIRWSPDGSAIAFLSWLDPNLSYSRQSLFIVDAAPAQNGACQVPRLIDPNFDFDLSDLKWSAQDGSLYAIAAIGACSEIISVKTHDNRIQLVKENGEDAWLRANLALDPGGLALAWIGESLSLLPELYLRDSAGVIHQLTELNSEFVTTYRAPQQEIVRWTAPDGVDIEGVLTYPLDYTEGALCPLVVQLHGGPKGRSAASMTGYYLAPVWSAAGYAVLAPNYRGSEGYGNSFAIAAKRDLGGADYLDVVSGVDHCIRIGLADRERLGIMGGSYGGFLVNCAITRTDRFRAAVSMFGIFNLQTDFSTSAYSRWNHEYLGAYYWEDPDVYHRLSPASSAANIRTPTLILHGDEDENTFIGNSRELYQALRSRGVATQFIQYPRESHGLSEPNHRLDEVRRCLGWMDRYLMPEKTYRTGDTVPSLNDATELTILRCETEKFVGGAPAQESASASITTIEVLVALNRRASATIPDTLTLRLADIVLTPLASTGLDSAMQGLTPVGVSMDLPGGKVVAEGDNLRVVQYPDIETHILSLAAAIVFRVPCAGEALLCIAGYPPVAVAWNSGESEGAAA